MTSVRDSMSMMFITIMIVVVVGIMTILVILGYLLVIVGHTY